LIVALNIRRMKKLIVPMVLATMSTMLPEPRQPRRTESTRGQGQGKVDIR
jgi:hypothetical protein